MAQDPRSLGTNHSHPYPKTLYRNTPECAIISMGLSYKYYETVKPTPVEQITIKEDKDKVEKLIAFASEFRISLNGPILPFR